MAALLAVAILYASIVLGVPAYLASGAALEADAADFSTDEGWILRPDARPDAIWESGWAIDFIVLPQIPSTLHKHGLLATQSDSVSRTIRAQQSAAVDLLGAEGPVYMPALRLPTQASGTPDWNTSRDDLVAALSAYFEIDNRGRAVALYAEPPLDTLLTDVPQLLEEAGAASAADRVVLILKPGDSGASLTASDALPNAAVFELGLGQSSAGLSGLMSLPTPSTVWTLDQNAQTTGSLGAAVAQALQRAESNARRTAEPFGAFEVVREAPINRPCEAGLRCRRD
ncbi:MAG: hypothetical protein AAFR33_00820 [Pseudomonadota bacterium]